MPERYQDLQTLLAKNPAADHYFRSLPDYVREQIGTRGDSVNSLSSLQDYAENLLRGDD